MDNFDYHVIDVEVKTLLDLCLNTIVTLLTLKICVNYFLDDNIKRYVVKIDNSDIKKLPLPKNLKRMTYKALQMRKPINILKTDIPNDALRPLKFFCRDFHKFTVVFWYSENFYSMCGKEFRHMTYLGDEAIIRFLFLNNVEYFT